MGKIKTTNRNDKKKEVLLLAQDIKFAKSLASNNKQLRERSLKALKKWLQIRSLKLPFSEKDFTLLWKGLFYTMWMSDKPLIQEECAENISALIHLSTWEDSLLFFKCGLRTLADSWFGIDQLRLDKFLMFVRRFLRQGLVILDNECWVPKVLEKFNETLSETVLSTTKLLPLGLTMHFTEIFLEELAKVSKGKIETSVTTTLLKPFIKQLALLKDASQVSHITKFVFRHLMWQSDLAMDYNDRYNEWKKLGFPGGTIDVIQKEEISDDKIMSDNEIGEDENVKPLDPRAGHVDVELPQIPFDPKEIATVLKEFRFIKNTTTRNRRCITKLIGEFEQISKGEFPLGVKQLPLIEKDHSMKLRQSVNRLVKFEKKILGKNKRKRKHSDETIALNSVEDESEAPPKIKKKKVMEKQLKEFIEKSERHLEGSIETLVKKKQKETKISDINKMNKVLSKRKRLATNLYKVEKAKVPGRKLKQLPVKNLKLENSFHRNSGTWYVYELKPLQKDQLTANLDNKTDSKLTTLSTSNLSDSPKPNDCPKRQYRDTLEFPTPQLNINNDSPKQQRNKTSELSGSDPRLLNDSPRRRSRTLSENFEPEIPKTLISPTSKPKSPISPRKLNDVLASEGPVTHQVSLQNLVGGGGSSKTRQKFAQSILKISSMEEKSSEPRNSKVSPSKLTAKLKLGNNLVTSTPKESASDKDIKNDSFPQNEWDTPLKEGEVEIFVPAKKFQKKMEELAQKNNQSLPNLLNNSLRKVRDVRKNCKDSNLVRNPFSKMNLTGNVKKVKIALNLNKSQEIHEHIKMIKSSPAIPFDAEKKPSKPLLKKPAIASPINPFYNNELNL